MKETIISIMTSEITWIAADLVIIAVPVFFAVKKCL